jgi:hypothetical protein
MGGEMGRYTVEGIEFDHLDQRNELLHIRVDFKFKFTEIDIDSLDNPVV